jgi:SSS family solute:Na+ symporter
MLVPNVFQSLRSNETLLLETQPSPIERTYTARELDVAARNLEILAWEDLSSQDKSITPQPEVLTIGQSFAKRYNQPSKTIFWSKQAGINEEGNMEARGYMFPELWLIHSLGFDLTQNPYALNESIRMMIRLLFPFLVLILVSLFTRENEDEITERFFLKMRTRVRGKGPEVDQQDLEEAMRNPGKTRDQLLFPTTSLEVYKWNRQDIIGFLIAVCVVFVVIGTLFMVVNLGS